MLRPDVSFCLFVSFAQADRAGAARALRELRLGESNRLHVPAQARDPYLDDGAPPALVVQLYFAELDALQAALPALRRALGEGASWEAMAVRAFAVAQPAFGRCTYLVAYAGPAEDPDAWRAHYLAHHAPIMAGLPGIRELEIYAPIERDGEVDGWRRVRSLQRNKVAFDGARMTLTCPGRSVVFHKEIKPAQPSAERVPVLVSQNYFRDDDRRRYVDGEEVDKYVAGELLVTNPTAAEEAVGLRVVHRERMRHQPVPLDERNRQQVRPRDAHRAGFGPQPRGEGIAQREHASADAVLRLHDDRVVPRAQQLGRGNQPGHPRADHEDARARGRARLEAPCEHVEVLGRRRGDHGSSGPSRTTSRSPSAARIVVPGGFSRHSPFVNTPTRSESCRSFSTSSACRTVCPASSGGTGTRYSS